MKGDIINIKPEYYKPSETIIQLLNEKISNSKKFVIGISGESGSGKSVAAVTLSEILDSQNIQNTILHMDDYFVLPPRTNHENRLKSIENVGLHEVHLALLEQNIEDFISNKHFFQKPVIDYQNNTIENETIDISECRVLIIEGTYIGSLKNIDTLIFMERNYKQTYQNRLSRNREEASEFIEKVLEIEHQIISKFKNISNIIIDHDYKVVVQNQKINCI